VHKFPRIFDCRRPINVRAAIKLIIVPTRVQRFLVSYTKLLSKLEIQEPGYGMRWLEVLGNFIPRRGTDVGSAREDACGFAAPLIENGRTTDITFSVIVLPPDVTIVEDVARIATLLRCLLQKVQERKRQSSTVKVSCIVS
jgi:hypothetical protein